MSLENVVGKSLSWKIQQEDVACKTGEFPCKTDGFPISFIIFKLKWNDIETLFSQIFPTPLFLQLQSQTRRQPYMKGPLARRILFGDKF